LKPRYDDGFARMFVGDACEVLSELPEKSVHCCVTSPPYFGLRSYLPSGHPDKAREGGTQETPEAYVEWLVEVFRGVWRVLRDDGTCWINLGDSYYTQPGKGGNVPQTKWPSNSYPEAAPHRSTALLGLKPKDLLMIPARVALALQADGWFLRSQIVWAKPNPMPESVTDRPTQATEMVYLFSKKPRYFYDAEAVKEPNSDSLQNLYRAQRGIKRKPSPKDLALAANGGNHRSATSGGEAGYGEGGRNLRNYWPISTRPFSGAHFATFPPELPMRCIKAGTSERGVCSECGAPYVRVVERTGETTADRARENGHADHANAYAGPQKQNLDFKGSHWKLPPRESRTIGFEPTCSCKKNPQVVTWGGPVSLHPSGDDGCNSSTPEVIPATVLDPFSGSGTTLLVARKLGRKSIGVDLDERNLKLVEERMGYQGVLL
jgi:DNA modification methylase